MRVCCYFPNKPFRYVSPSGDRTISEHLVRELSKKGHFWTEASSFRSRFFWLHPAKVLTLPFEVSRTVLRVSKFKPDLWLTYHSYYKSPDVFGWWISRINRAKRVKYVIFQGMYSTKPKRKAKLKTGYIINAVALKRADLVFSNNIMDLSGLKRIVPETRLVYLPPGIFPEDFTFSPDVRREIRSKYCTDGEKVVLTVSRFRPGVKFHSLCFLFRSLSFVKIPFKLIVVGSGPMEREVLGLARDLERKNKKAQVIFVGQIARKDLWRYYSAADIFAFPGIGESLGMVYLEAQACALPVIALDGPGVSQVVKKGITGILVAEGSHEKYAVALEDLLENDELRSRMGEAAREFVMRERNAHVHYARFVEILEGLVNNDF